MSLWTPEEVQKTLAKIRERISKDEAYQKFCLENPHAAIKELSGKELPTGLKVDFTENGEARLNIEVPAENLPEGELCDYELENVTGGVTNSSDVRAWWQMISSKHVKVKVDMPTGIAGIRG
ncbi:MAG: hypothetical protein WA118_12195 [Carboxydocellales bacterium]